MGRIRVKPEARQRAAGYLRISDRRKQGDNHSEDVQRANIGGLAAREGYTIILWDGDQERGRKTVDRPGYVRLLEVARSGDVGAIMVNHTSRWGRKTAEMVARLDELDAAGIAFYSVAQGRLRPGLVSTLLFAIDEEFCRTLAHNVRPARQEGARAGVHQGPTPFGYRRVYPAWDGMGKRPPGQLVRDDVTAWIVVELYQRYAAGATCRELALWLNLEVHRPPPRTERTGCMTWADDTVWGILRNPTYRGVVPYDKRGQGAYEHAEPGDYFEAPGHHESLVSAELWQAVQDRMHHRALAPAGGRPQRQRTARRYLGAGLLVCRACGSPMRVHSSAGVTGHKGTYLCWGALRGRSLCSEPGYRMDLAHQALLAEVSRLRGAPWDARAAERLLRAPEDQGEHRRRLERALGEEQALLRGRARVLSLRADAGPAEVAAFAEVARESEARIAALQAEVAGLEPAPRRLADLRSLHADLARLDMAHALAGIDPERSPEHYAAVRDLLTRTVERAVVSERAPGRYARWLRLEVTWTPLVHALLEAGYLFLEAPPVLVSPG